MRNDSRSVKIKIDASSPVSSEMRTAAFELLLQGLFFPVLERRLAGFCC